MVVVLPEPVGPHKIKMLYPITFDRGHEVLDDHAAAKGEHRTTFFGTLPNVNVCNLAALCPLWIPFLRLRTFSGPLEMPSPETKILDRAESEVEQIFERMRRHCERALAIFRDINLDELSPENREQVHRQIHTLREFVRILSPDFEKKLMVEAAKLGRDLSREEALCLLYGLEKF